MQLDIKQPCLQKVDPAASNSAEESTWAELMEEVSLKSSSGTASTTLHATDRTRDASINPRWWSDDLSPVETPSYRHTLVSKGSPEAEDLSYSGRRIRLDQHDQDPPAVQQRRAQTQVRKSAARGLRYQRPRLQDNENVQKASIVSQSKGPRSPADSHERQSADLQPYSQEPKQSTHPQDSQNSALQHAHALLQARSSGAAGMSMQHDKELIAAMTNLQAAQESQRQLQESNAGLQRDVTALNMQLGEVQGKLHAKQQAGDDAVARCAIMSARIEDLQGELADQTAFLLAESALRSELEDNGRVKEDAIAELEASREACQFQLRSLQAETQELRYVREECEVAQAQCKDFQIKKNAIEARLVYHPRWIALNLMCMSTPGQKVLFCEVLVCSTQPSYRHSASLDCSLGLDRLLRTPQQEGMKGRTDSGVYTESAAGGS